MGITELVLLIFGGVVFTVSFFLPSGQGKDEEGISQVDEEQIKEIIDREVAEAKSQIHDIVDETITYSMEKTERSMERLSNEKIMAVNEYSDTVLEQINKNHNEVVFLYDMLNDKHENLKNTVSEVTKTASEVKQAVKDAEITAMEVKARAQEAKEAQDNLKMAAALPSKIENKAVATVPEAKPEAVLQAPVAEPEFIPILPEKVEIVAVPEAMPQEIEKKDEAVPEKTAKPKKRAGRKPKAETPQKAESVDKIAKKEKKEQSQNPEEKAGTKKAAEEIVKSVEPTDETTKEEKPAGGESTEKMDAVMSVAVPEKTADRNNNERILELHRAGKSNMAIAKELSLGVGEVKLVIDLFEGM